MLSPIIYSFIFWLKQKKLIILPSIKWVTYYPHIFLSKTGNGYIATFYYSSKSSTWDTSLPPPLAPQSILHVHARCHQLRQSPHLEVLSIHPSLQCLEFLQQRQWVVASGFYHSPTGIRRMAHCQFSNCCPPVSLEVNIPTLLFQQHIIVQLSHPPLILDLPCQLPFLVYKDGRFHLNHTPHSIHPPPRITSECSHFIWGLRVRL